MSRYSIQLATYHRAKRLAMASPVFRAVILQGDTPIATTVQAWPENAGCGRSAAINEAQQVIAAIDWQDYQSCPLSLKSLNSLKQQPFTGKEWQLMLWGFALWYAIVAVFGACK